MKRCTECGFSEGLQHREDELDVDGIAVVQGHVYTCPECDTKFRGYDRYDDLMRGIAQQLARDSSRRLTHLEQRWLRKYLGFSTKSWGAYLGVTRETVSGWENNKRKMSLGHERLLRMLVERGEAFRDYHTEDSMSPASSRTQPLHMRRNSIGEWVRE